ncbi:UNVERIFIED_CONTAM: hypothetical protein GTU68_038631 [Idotea baltica]|nr:hypothetical protein [Idotea baltica]
MTDDSGEKTNVAEFQPVDEPIYGEYYLPRKFKMGIALPEDNCIDVYTQDLGFLAVVEDDEIVGYNMLVGGGMGRTPAKKDTFPRLADELAFVTPGEAIAVSEAVMKVQRDFGNRENRKRARMKYVIEDWGIEKFCAKVEEYHGSPLTAPRDVKVTGVDDHVGWHEQGDGKLFLGINIENGRIKDDGDLKIKTALRTLFTHYGMDSRLTALQGLILCDIDPADRADIDKLLADHGMKSADELSLARRYSIACPAFPTCGLSITESERVLPQVIDTLDTEIAKLGMQAEKISIHMTGCPNGCARPYTPDVGLVGKAVGKYTMFLGGNAEGTRLCFVYRDMVTLDDIVPTLVPLLTAFKAEKQGSESFGDYCDRLGQEELEAKAAAAA